MQRRFRHAFLAQILAVSVATPAAARVVLGRYTELLETRHEVPLGHGADFMLTFWSIANANRGYLYALDWPGWPGRYAIAAATSVTFVGSIQDASQLTFLPWSVGPVCDADCDPEGTGDFVVLRNEDSGHYAAARVDDIRSPGGWDSALLDLTWWFQTDGSSDLSRFPRPTLDIMPGRCPNILVRNRDEPVEIAVAGSAGFAALDVAMDRLRLQARLAPRAWRFADVTSPGSGPGDEACDCRGGARRPDGIVDAVLEYAASDVLALLEPVGHHDTRTLFLEGALADATFFYGEDCVTVVGGPELEPKAGVPEDPPRAQIVFDLPEPRHVQVSIYDVRGRLVDRLVDGPQPAGSHALAWTPKRAPRGIYVWRLEAGALRRSGKLLHFAP